MTEFLPGPIQVKPEEPATLQPFHIIVCPDSDMHVALAQKLSTMKLRPGQIVPLSLDEMALLSEFVVWPNRPPTV